MKVLLDECLPIDFRLYLTGHEAHTAEWAGFKGMKNGQLLRELEQAGYQALITADQAIQHQQSLANRAVSILIIRAPTNQIEDLLPTVQIVLEKLARIQPGEIVSVP